MNASDLQTVFIDLQQRSYHIAIRGSLFDNPLTYAAVSYTHLTLPTNREV